MSEKISNAARIEWADFAKGVAMILVVIGHVIDFHNILCTFPAAFRMPFFFVIAGFFLNLNKWGSSENFKPFVTKLFNRLIIPYFIANFLWYPIWFFVCHEEGLLGYSFWGWTKVLPVDAFNAILSGNGNNGLVLIQMWFLPALFFAEIIFVVLWNRLNKFGVKIFALAVVIFSCIGLYIKDFVVLYFGIDIALVALIFLLSGIFIRKNNFVERIDLKIFVILTAIVIGVFFFNEHIDMNFRLYGNSILFYAGGIAGSLLVMKLSMLAAKVRGKFFTLIEDCGKETMLILVLHPIIANIFYEILAQNTDISPDNFLLNPAISFTATVLGVLIPLFIAKKFGKLPVLKHFCS